MPALPNPSSIVAAIGSQFVQNYQIKNPDGTLTNISSSTFEFVVRTDPAVTNASSFVFSVNSSGSTANGVITVNTVSSTVTVTLTPTATNLLTQQQYFYTLWQNQGTSTATALVTGTFFALAVAQP